MIDSLSNPSMAHQAVVAAAIPADRARSLSRWNRVLAFLHGVQFVAMIAVGSTAVAFAPFVATVKPIIENGVFAGIERVEVQLLSIPLAWVIASFLAMSAFAHALAGWPLRGPLRILAGAWHEPAPLGRVRLQQHRDDRRDRLYLVHP